MLVSKFMSGKNVKKKMKKKIQTDKHINKQTDGNVEQHSRKILTIQTL